MPKIYLSEKDRLSDRFTTWVYGQMKSNRVTQKQLAEDLHITQQALSYKLKNRQFSFADFVTIVDVFAPNSSELAWLVGKKESI